MPSQAMNQKVKREFKPALPAPLLAALPKDSPERWMYEQQDIQRQQNEAILERMDAGEERFEKADSDREAMKLEMATIARRLAILERIKERLTAKWSLAAAALGLLAIPILLIYIEELIKRWFGKHP
jgi:hypothetical protein